MRLALKRVLGGAVLLTGVAAAGINWKAVWIEPYEPVIVKVGQTSPYTVMGLNGANVTGELTRSPYLKIASSDPAVIEVDQKNGVFIGKKEGQAEIRVSFSEATAIVKAVVRPAESNQAAR